MRPVRPTSLLALAGVFIAWGVGWLLLPVIAIVRGTGGASFSFFDLANLAIGLGLLRRQPYWHRSAVAVIWLRIVITMVPLAYLVLAPAMGSVSLFGKPLSQIPRPYVFAYVLANLSFGVWALHVLRRPAVRAVFSPNEVAQRGLHAPNTAA